MVTNAEIQEIVADTLLVLSMLILIIALYKAHLNDEVPIRFEDALIDDTGSWGSKARLNIAFFVMTMILTFLALTGSLTEFYATVYVTAWVVDRARSSVTEVLKGKQNEPSTN